MSHSRQQDCPSLAPQSWTYSPALLIICHVQSSAGRYPVYPLLTLKKVAFDPEGFVPGFPPTAYDPSKELLLSCIIIPQVRWHVGTWTVHTSLLSCSRMHFYSKALLLPEKLP